MSKYEEIRRQTVNEDWTAEVVADATIDDLDKEAIAKAREGYKQRYPTLAKECDGWEDKVFLDKAGLTIDGNYSLMLLANQDMSLMDAVLLDQVQKGKPISDNAIKKLRKEGLIEGRKPHLYVSKQIAKATNTQVEYTLKKGFNDAECQEWIMKALNDHKVLSRKQINELLWNKLPVDFTDTQRLNKIGNLLMRMKRDGVIKLDEKRMWHAL
jgi:ATP-dependent DNA helicase RecG